MYLSKDYKVQNTSDVNTLFEIPELADFLTYRKDIDVYLFWQGESQCLNPADKNDYFGRSVYSLYNYIEEFDAKTVWRRGTLVEYLNPADWSLHVVDVDNDEAGEDWIKVPDGANFATSSDGWNGFMFWKSMESNECFVREENNGWKTGTRTLSDYLKRWLGCTLVWQRYSQPEELPFVDDEPKHQHYFKDFSDCKKVDVYRVLDRFNVVHPCQQHIAKKSLCAGNRGHKDLLRDIQDIIDTAERWREMLLEDSRDGEG